jgi:hypothetical protein
VRGDSRGIDGAGIHLSMSASFPLDFPLAIKCRGKSCQEFAKRLDDTGFQLLRFYEQNRVLGENLFSVVSC